ncbi:MAG: hypothetical protein IJ983_01575, partial [Kiritimatiellae bacterium]|nr:hypothetical protein [Kiritimatiellia bacterium]
PPGAARRGRIEVTVYTHVLNIFCDHKRAGAKWDVKFWNPQHDADSTPGLFSVGFTARSASDDFGRSQGAIDASASVISPAGLPLCGAGEMLGCTSPHNRASAN